MTINIFSPRCMMMMCHFHFSHYDKVRFAIASFLSYWQLYSSLCTREQQPLSLSLSLSPRKLCIIYLVCINYEKGLLLGLRARIFMWCLPGLVVWLKTRFILILVFRYIWPLVVGCLNNMSRTDVKSCKMQKKRPQKGWRAAKRMHFEKIV